MGFFNAHIKSVPVEFLKYLNVLRYLKHLKWGVSKDLLQSFYKVLVCPIIEYGKEVYFNSADSSLQLMEKIQNDNLRLLSGALKSTPINCLQHHCNEMPATTKFEQLCLYYRTHLCTITSHSNQPISADIKDIWQDRFPDSPNFTFQYCDKAFFLIFSDSNKHNCSNLEFKHNCCFRYFSLEITKSSH